MFSHWILLLGMEQSQSLYEQLMDSGVQKEDCLSHDGPERRTQCYCVLCAEDESFEKNYEVQREKRNILNKDKFKTPNSLKFQIVFPHSKSISHKWGATRDSGISLSVLLWKQITGLLSPFKLPDFHLGSYELFPPLLPKLILSLHLKHYPLLLWGRWNIYLSKCPSWIKLSKSW